MYDVKVALGSRGLTLQGVRQCAIDKEWRALVHMRVIENDATLSRVIYTLSGRTGSALAWHTQRSVFAPRLLQKVLRFVARIYTMQYVEHRGYCPVCGGGQSIESTVSDAIVHNWLWSTATGSCQLRYFSSIPAGS